MKKNTRRKGMDGKLEKSTLRRLTAPYRVCPECGAHLDPGEKCDCQKNLEFEQIFIRLLQKFPKDHPVWQEMRSFMSALKDGKDEYICPVCGRTNTTSTSEPCVCLMLARSVGEGISCS